MIGKRHTTETVRYGLSKDNRPAFEGMTIYKGRIPFEQRVKDRVEPVCDYCDERAMSGVYSVAVTEWWFVVRLRRRVDAINFECLSCLHERDPVTYPVADLMDAAGG